MHSKGEWAGKPFKLDTVAARRDHLVRCLGGSAWMGRGGTGPSTWRCRARMARAPWRRGWRCCCCSRTTSRGQRFIARRRTATRRPSCSSEAEDDGGDIARAGAAAQMYSGGPSMCRRSRSVYRVLSADAFTKHGLNAHGVIFDELHAQPTRELWDVLTTGTGAQATADDLCHHDSAAMTASRFAGSSTNMRGR